MESAKHGILQCKDVQNQAIGSFSEINLVRALSVELFFQLDELELLDAGQTLILFDVILPTHPIY